MGRFDARITAKGQTTVPVEVRKRLGVAPGQTIQFVTLPDGRVEVIAKQGGIAHLKGLFGTGGPPVDVEREIEAAIAERTSARGEAAR